jgi:signal transduction histidine kinase
LVDQDGATENQRQGRGVLADEIGRHHAEIVQRWLQRVTDDIARTGRNIAQTELRDGIDDYLTRLAGSLRAEGNVLSEGTQAWKDVARGHAVTRVRLGFDISQLVHEFIVLRESMLEVFTDGGLRLDAEQTNYLATLIDAAIAVAVESYVESRDDASRAQQAQHIGFITHELRNPLTTAKTAASQLRRQGAGAGSIRLVDALDRSLDKLSRLVEQVLLSERLDSGDVQCDRADVPLGQIMEDAIRAAAHDARTKGLHFHARYDPELMLYVDPALAISAVQNVVDNAVKFTDDGNVEVDGEDRGGEIAIHVRDNCKGLSQDDLARIFEPFRRGRSGKPGSGLGLTIARRAVEAQGGTITAAPAESGGCHFTLTLPKSRH